MDVFISHASEDKERIVIPLAQALKSEGIRIWYDEENIRDGESIRDKIDSALGDCQWGIIIFSKYYLKKEWTRLEYDALVDKHIRSQHGVLIPIWHDIKFSEIVEESPILATLKGISTAKGLNKIVARILKVINGNDLKLNKYTFPKTNRLPRLVNPPLQNLDFVGCEISISIINSWTIDENVRIGSIIGIGGVGKSSIIRHWYDNQSDLDNFEGVFIWGFYQNYFVTHFIDSLLTYLSDITLVLSDFNNNWEKLDVIKKQLRLNKLLIILDGFEELQNQEGNEYGFGQIYSSEINELLRFFVSDNDVKGKIFITTRFPIVNFSSNSFFRYKTLELDGLTIEDGILLMKKIGIKGEREQIEKVISAHNSHPLSLTLLSSYLVNYYEGEIEKLSNIPPLYEDESIGEKVYSILKVYAERLNKNQLIILNIISSLKDLVSKEQFAEIFGVLQGDSSNKSSFLLLKTINNLSKRRMIKIDSEGLIQMHPLVKGFYENNQSEINKTQLHKQLFYYFKAILPKTIDKLEDVTPYLNLFYHGCRSSNLFHKIISFNLFRNKLIGRGFKLNFNLNGWALNMELASQFFPNSEIDKSSSLSWSAEKFLLNEYGLSALQLGKVKLAEKALHRGDNVPWFINNAYVHAPIHMNLCELYYRKGDFEKVHYHSGKSRVYLPYYRSFQFLSIAHSFRGLGKSAKGNMNNAKWNFRLSYFYFKFWFVFNMPLLFHLLTFGGFALICLYLTSIKCQQANVPFDITIFWKPYFLAMLVIYFTFIITAKFPFFGQSPQHLAYCLIKNKKLHKAEEVIKESKKASDFSNYLQGEITNKILLSEIYRRKGELDDAKKELKDIEDTVVFTNIHHLKIEYLIEKVSLLIIENKKERLLETLEECFILSKQADYKLYISQILWLKSKAYFLLNDFNKSKEHRNLALDMAKEIRLNWLVKEIQEN